MSKCGEYPTVLNGKIASNTSTTVEYECLGGFYISGDPRINCTNSGWGTAPTCSVIRDEINIFRECLQVECVVVTVLFR
ncbi:hypothetical protein C0Q70_14636 [Pomacea canaliculata]|uniref:Sushi domain-containing protein n=1 Tax=Pomacea canaliculata TaxID=400727 RepID=A0A2T7NSN7_POMCA|nr:hypothetical protein C0Q70_14636 [Pomacea canaliculata]